MVSGESPVLTHPTTATTNFLTLYTTTLEGRLQKYHYGNYSAYLRSTELLTRLPY